ATSLAERIGGLGAFPLLTHGSQLPGFAFTLADTQSGVSGFDVSTALREQGWQGPAYTFPDNRTDPAAPRIVVRHGFSHDLADLLFNHLSTAVDRLRRQEKPQHGEECASFAHGT